MTPLSVPEYAAEEGGARGGTDRAASRPLPAALETLPALLDARLAATPDAPAYAESCDGAGWHFTTWSEHAHRVRLLARALAYQGLARGDRVLILAPTSLAWERVQMAVFGCGAVAVGVDPRTADAHLEQIVRRVAPAALVVGEAGLLDRLPTEVVTTAKFRLSLTHGGRREGVLTLDALPQAVDLGPDPWGCAQPDDPALVVFTSGTTGDPRGIAYSHRQVCLACESLLATFPQLAPGDRFACWLPLANLFQRMVNFFAIARGATTYFVADPRQLMALLPAIRPHMLIGVPRFYEKLHAGIEARIAAAGPLKPLLRLALRVGEAQAAARRRGERPGLAIGLGHALFDPLILARFRRALGGELRFLISGSAPMPVWLLERLHGLGLTVLEAYGTSEDIIPIAANRLDAYRFGAVGRPLPGNEVRLSADGEVEVRGPGVFAGYLDEPDRDMFTADGFLRTGDEGRFDDDGFLVLTGRRSEIFKTSTGRRIAPAGIEQRLLTLPWVEHALVTGAGRKFVVALLAVNPAALAQWAQARGLPDVLDDPPAPVLAAALWQAVQAATDELPPHERPAGCVLLPRPFSVEAGELTTNLKLRRRVVHERYAPCLERLHAAVDAGTASVQVCT